MLVHILTGPPGSGKSTYAKKHLPSLQVFDTDLQNKSSWRVYRGEECVLMTSAPSAPQKEYWINQVKLKGQTSKLYVLWVDRMVAYKRMKGRSGLKATERHDLEQSVERWYKLYSRHPQEIRIENE